VAFDPTGRHPATVQIMRWFVWEHLRPGLPQEISMLCARTAEDMAENLPDGPELTTGLRKLLEAKDCFVREAVATID